MNRTMKYTKKDHVNGGNGNLSIETRIQTKWKTIHDMQSRLNNNASSVGASIMTARSQLSGQMGKSYAGRRDMYKLLGYKIEPEFQDYYDRYRRQDIAKAVVDAPVTASWRLYPSINENEGGDETEFEKAISDLEKEKKIYHYLSRVDRLSGIGQYAVLLMGFRDGQKMEKEVKNGNELLYLQAYTEDNAKIDTVVTDTKDPRYGLPETYKVNVSLPNKDLSTGSIIVHHSRVLHVSEGMLESDVYGISRLEPVLNRLFDLDLILGGGAEMFWRGAFPGFGLIARPDAYFSDDGQDLQALESEMDAYIHNMQRYFRVQDVDIQQMNVQVADPSNHLDAQLIAISAATGIPKRILIGSERGELASSQDETAWNTKVDERRTNYLEPMIVRPFLDKLISIGVLSEPANGYTVEWGELFVPDAGEKATVAKTKAEAIAKYADSPESQHVVPLDMFLKKVMEFTDEEVEQATDTIVDTIEEEENQAIEDAKLEREQAIEDGDRSLEGDLKKIDKQGSFKSLPKGFKA